MVRTDRLPVQNELAVSIQFGAIKSKFPDARPSPTLPAVIQTNNWVYHSSYWDPTKETCCGNHQETLCDQCYFTNWAAVKSHYVFTMECPSCRPPNRKITTMECPASEVRVKAWRKNREPEDKDVRESETRQLWLPPHLTLTENSTSTTIGNSTSNSNSRLHIEHFVHFLLKAYVYLTTSLFIAH
ncbi:hypothetical protein B0T16DRAFT_391260 [Cercophora newfieldiana]|uniref:Uncharacterized protein n=1 Tax=Cercophora newfieldiana TaxID=92897 RepID=A0AA40CQG8_9PEZI|nr:hypothetical protein B0T16DRAFT_391260 [Cercophora newfieldiana]